MSTKRFVARTAAWTATSGILLALTAAPAQAHVTANPETAERGGYAKIAFRVPNEKDDAATVSIKVQLPAQHPLSSVRVKPMPGWTAQLEKVQIPPTKVAGSEVTETVRSITWTAQPGQGIKPDQFQEFEASLGALPENTDKLELPTTQTYDNGEVVAWDQPTPPSGEEPEHPAPTLQLVPGEGHQHGGGAQPAAHHSAEQAGPATDDTARYLGGAGLLVGALGVGVGAGALARGRRSSGGDAS
ncbi:YcnI family protein [Saccharopolyspora griseoalba]|uniref:YcnI family protein n=1 Tax=Saccharopolyspora griseoalba TaxID=1431848 RepID=A0ABW2LMW7_9PSEU